MQAFPIQNSKKSQATASTGIHALDAYLPEAGWPVDGIIDLHVSDTGASVLPLLLPHMARLSQTTRWLAWLAPPFAPYLPALQRAGVDVSHLLIIRPRQDVNGLEILERALSNGNFVSVFAWPLAQDAGLMQRLRSAAQQGRCQAFLFRPAHMASYNKAARLSLVVEPAGDGYRIQRLKSGNTRADAGITISHGELQHIRG